MNLKKSAIAATVAATLGAPAVVSADTIHMNFTGVFSLVGSTGNVNPNSDATGAVDGQGNSYLFGSRTPFSGTGTIDTNTGAGSINIDSFSFFGNGLASASSFSIQAIGDGMGSIAGTLVGGAMGFNWNNAGFSIPVTAIFDAAGFFDSIIGFIGAPGSSWTVQTGCAGCAISPTPDLLLGVDFIPTVGAVPMAMTTFNTAGTTLGTLFPLTDDSIVGSPLTTAPFPGQNFAFDFTTIHASNGMPAVPAPAAAWLFGSGLVGLVSVARRRRRN